MNFCVLKEPAKDYFCQNGSAPGRRVLFEKQISLIRGDHALSPHRGFLKPKETGKDQQSWQYTFTNGRNNNLNGRNNSASSFLDTTGCCVYRCVNGRKLHSTGESNSD